MVKSIEWEKEKVIELLKEHGELHARFKTPHGSRKILVDQLGEIRGKCFKTCLLIAKSYPDKFYYCEGYANGKPHAWLKPKTIKKEPNDYWCLDPTWPWKPKSYKNQPLDDITYIGIAVDPIKAINKLKELKGSCSLLKMIGQWSIEELK